MIPSVESSISVMKLGCGKAEQLLRIGSIIPTSLVVNTTTIMTAIGDLRGN